MLLGPSSTGLVVRVNSRLQHTKVHLWPTSRARSSGNRQNEGRRLRNKAVRSELKTRAKRAVSAAEQGAEDSVELTRLALQRLDKAASKGVIHKNQGRPAQEPAPEAGRHRRRFRRVSGGRSAPERERRSQNVWACTTGSSTKD